MEGELSVVWVVFINKWLTYYGIKISQKYLLTLKICRSLNLFEPSPLFIRKKIDVVKQKSIIKT